MKPAHMRPGLRLVRHEGHAISTAGALSAARDEATVSCLRALLGKAEAGEIVGLVYAAVEPNREYFFAACGEADRNPSFAGQMASALWFGTMKRVFGEGA